MALIAFRQIRYQVVFVQLLQLIQCRHLHDIRDIPGGKGKGHLPVVIVPVGFKFIHNLYIQLILQHSGVSIIFIGIAFRQFGILQCLPSHHYRNRFCVRGGPASRLRCPCFLTFCRTGRYRCHHGESKRN